ncbi:MAG: hypothetical protein JKY69_01545 [Flavobacteriaceae bacterium]|nr:hypothetical protein [Flavobacteriaceae bacterium]
MNALTTYKSTLIQKTAAILALLLGLMSVFAGSKVLLEIDAKDYNILVWLVTYNVIFGAISIVVANFIWKNKAKAKSLILFVLAMHFAVFMYLKFVSLTIAHESIKAMLFRTSAWILIAVLALIIPKYLGKQKH